MATTRPYFTATGPELRELFEDNRRDPRVLRAILAELKHRTSPTAQTLRREVERAMVLASGYNNSSVSAGRATPPPPPHQQQQPSAPTHQILKCRGCSAKVRVPVRTEHSVYSCPTCKTRFETVYKDGLLQVVWVEAQASPNESTDAMTDDVAREILGVSAGANFDAIKAAWRRSSQQYHPDKHQALPERLRRAAELEMKRINEAYRYLEASTASEF